MSTEKHISIIVPVYNEQDTISNTLQRLQAMRNRGHEVIVVDGGSSDATITIVAQLADQVLIAKKGRGHQMMIGACAARKEMLWFLHADTKVPEDADQIIGAGLKKSGRQWGRFDIRLSGAVPILRIVEWAMNLRSRLTSIATGDQGIFVSRCFYERAGGMPDQPLMEDIALSGRLKKLGKPLCLRETIETSSRRWEEQGVLMTIMRMWLLRTAYALGASPNYLASRYK